MNGQSDGLIASLIIGIADHASISSSVRTEPNRINPTTVKIAGPLA